MDRYQLLQDRIRENKDPQAIVVSTCHPKPNTLPCILKNELHFKSFQTKAYCRLPKNQTTS